MQDTEQPGKGSDPSMVGLGLTLRLDRLMGLVAVIGFTGLVVISFLIFYDGSARYSGLPQMFGFADYGEVIYPIVIATCFPAALLRGTNVSVTMFGTALGRRGGAWLEAFAAVVTLVFFTVLVWQFAIFADGLGTRTSRTGVLTLQPFWWIATAITALCVPVQLWVTVIRMRCAVTGERAPFSELRHSDTIGG